MSKVRAKRLKFKWNSVKVVLGYPIDDIKVLYKGKSYKVIRRDDFVYDIYKRKISLEIDMFVDRLGYDEDITTNQRKELESV